MSPDGLHHPANAVDEPGYVVAPLGWLAACDDCDWRDERPTESAAIDAAKAHRAKEHPHG